ncbi:MAG TPA: APC family permease [Methylomirabilota bacterium]|nr:APC family permease [Methylomirabilota bacterium]
MIGKSKLPPAELGQKRVSKLEGLAAFSPDALASIGYADQEVYLGLVIAGSVGLAYALPIALAISGLLAILAVSYYQVVQKFPSGGGSYEVARTTLGTVPGLVAAAALIVNYLLNVSVSLTTGVDAIASAFPQLWPHRVVLSLVLLGAITALNLRGMRESGIVMAIPVYIFLFAYLPMLGYGGLRLSLGGVIPLTPLARSPLQPLTTALLLHTFSTGCTAMTGIEAISNGVPSFRPPETKNAGQTMIVMALLMGTLFLGSIGLIQYLAVIAGPQETILSALAHRLLGNSIAYLIIQASTMILLTVGANTSFAGLPRLMSVMANDGYLPKRLARMNSRSVFVNGILLLSAASGVLIVVFAGSSHALIPLFAVGVFLAWTLSQVGMVILWRQERGKGWRLKALLNGVGAAATGVTFIIVGTEKFFDGAWIAVLLIPILVAIFIQIHGRGRADAP